jgi:hypothetical protein
VHVCERGIDVAPVERFVCAAKELLGQSYTSPKSRSMCVSDIPSASNAIRAI